MWWVFVLSSVLIGCAEVGSSTSTTSSSSSSSSGDIVDPSGSGTTSSASVGSTNVSSSSTSSSSTSSSSVGSGGSDAGTEAGGSGGGDPAGSTQCVGLEVQTLDAVGDWKTTAICPFVCQNGACSGVCSPGYGKCNGVVAQTCNEDGQWVDGPTCPFVCSQGTCTGACNPGDVQCNGSSVQTCDPGGTWHDTQVCPFICQNGACSGVCSPGVQQCDVNTPQTCGKIGQWTSEADCPFLCSNGTCVGVCNPGDKRCDGNGTETCDSYGQWGAPVACPAPANTTATCSGNGTCGWTCQNGFDDCDGNSANGCEADLSSPSTCGSCKNSCSSVGGTATCSNGSCGIACNQGYADCNAVAGCETKLGTLTDCRSCGEACPTPANAVPLCGANGCGFTCSSSHQDCDNNPANGCEVDTYSDLTNCGGCSITCVGVGASCMNGVCSGPVKVTDASSITSLALGTPFSVNELFWTTSTGSVVKAPTDGGMATTLTTGQKDPVAIQMTGQNIIWATSDAAIRSMPVGGGAITNLVMGFSPVEMTNDGQNLFFTTWTDYTPCYCTSTSATSIFQLALSGGTPTTINPEVNSNIWASWPGLVVTDSYVQRIQWATTNAVSTVIGQNKTSTADFYGGGGGGVYVNGSFESFTSGQFLVKNTNDDMAMYTVLTTSGAAFVKMHSSQNAALISIAGGLTVRGIAIDNDNLYVVGRFSPTDEDRLIRYPLVGGSEEDLLNNLYNAANLYVDDTHVYFSIDGTKVGLNTPTLAPMIVRLAK